MEQTQFRRFEQYHDRWTSSGASTGIVRLSEKLSVAELRRYEIFRGYDDQFLETISPDVSVALWSKDALLFEEGSYIDVAFYIVAGVVGVYLANLANRAGATPIFRDGSSGNTGVIRLGDGSGTSVHFEQTQRPTAPAEVPLLATMDFDLGNATEVQLGPGEIFGEIGALSGWPQSLTA